MSRARSLHADQGGQISFFMAFAAVALVALIGLVSNTGKQARLKIKAQNGADAVALTSATWIARGLNVHSAINVTQTQLIGGSIVMHANHQAVAVTHPIACYLGFSFCTCASTGIGCLACCVPCGMFTVNAALLMIPNTVLNGSSGQQQAAMGPQQYAGPTSPCTPMGGGLDLCYHLAENTGQRAGAFWQLSEILETVNTKVVKPVFSGLAAYQSYQVARANHLDFGWSVSLGSAIGFDPEAEEEDEDEEPADRNRRQGRRSRCGPAGTATDIARRMIPVVPTDCGTQAEFCEVMRHGGPGYDKLLKYGHSDVPGVEEGDGPWTAGKDRSAWTIGNFGTFVGTWGVILGLSEMYYKQYCPESGGDLRDPEPIEAEIDSEASEVPIDPPRTVAGCNAQDGFARWTHFKAVMKGPTYEPVKRLVNAGTPQHAHVDSGSVPHVYGPGDPPPDPVSAPTTHMPSGSQTTGGVTVDNIGGEPTKTDDPDIWYYDEDPDTEDKDCGWRPGAEFTREASAGGHDGHTYQRRLRETVVVQPFIPEDPCDGEHCADGVDNDGDDLVDCDDSNCSNDPACRNDPTRESNCGNGLDDDRDGHRDCNDPDCDGDPACAGRENCTNGIDDDEPTLDPGDRAVDCDDSDCFAHPACGRQGEHCANGVDDDLDGLSDCDDPDCSSYRSCPTGSPCEVLPEVAEVSRDRYLVEVWSLDGYFKDLDPPMDTTAEPDEVNQQAKDKIPIPMVMDAEGEELKRHLQFVGLGTVSPGTSWAPRLFGTSQTVVTVAQAEVYNEIDETTWAQDWRVRLVPVDLASDNVGAAIALIQAVAERENGAAASASKAGTTLLTTLVAPDKLNHH